MKRYLENTNKKGGFMRTIITVSVAAVLFAAVLSNAGSGVSVQVSVGGPAGYVSYSNCDWDNMDREDLIIVNDNMVGFWVMLPSGRWVFRCRSMWYNNGYDEWCYGPWWDNYSFTYSAMGPFHLFGAHVGVWFHPYIYKHYPKYWRRAYANRELPFRERLARDDGNFRFEDRRDHNWSPGNHPIMTVETTRIVTPGRTHSADRDGGIRSMENRQPNAGACNTSRPQSMGNGSHSQNQPSCPQSMGNGSHSQNQSSCNRPSMRRGGR
jgi:hypothetical protein